MFEKNEFKAAIVRKGLTVEDLAKKIKINAATLHRKMSGSSDFTRSEINSICKVLGLSSEDMLRIFFA